ncbi:VOC family protein [Phytohabitans aurantiacus]
MRHARASPLRGCGARSDRRCRSWLPPEFMQDPEGNEFCVA